MPGSDPPTRSAPRVAIVGSGITGLAAASYLHTQSANGHHLHLTLFEHSAHIGGHAYTQHVDNIAVDTGFMVCNAVTYPNMLRWFDRHGVQLETSDMSLSVSMHDGALEWSSNGLTGLFAQKRNLLNPYFAGMVRDVVRFKGDVLAFLESEEKKLDGEGCGGGGAMSDELAGMTLNDFITRQGYGRYFVDYYLLPVCSSVWSCPTAAALQFPAYFILTFLRNHHLLQLTNRPQWLTVAGRSQDGYVQKVIAPFKQHIHTHTTVKALKRNPDGTVTLTLADTSPAASSSNKAERTETFDHVVLACHAPQALELLGEAATAEERRLLSAFQTQSNKVVLHQDASFLPRRAACHAAWNFLGSGSSTAEPSSSDISLTYYLNKLQNLPATTNPILVTLNPLHSVNPSLHISTTTMSHPVPTIHSYAALRHMPSIQGAASVWYGGAWLGFGFHEDGYKAGEAAGWGVWDAVVRRESGGGLVKMVTAGGGEVDGGKVNGHHKERVMDGEKRQNGHTSKPSDDYGHNGFTNGNISPTSPTPTTNKPDTTTNGAKPTTTTLTTKSVAHTTAVYSSYLPAGYTPLSNPVSFHERYPLLSLTTPARLVTLAFFRSFIQQGHVVLREDGGTIESFGPQPDSPSSTTPLHCTLYIHSPAFYTHIAYRADLGFADAYIDGSVSSPQLLQFFQILILNRDINQRANNGRISVPQLATSLLTTTAAYLTHALLRHNSVTQSRSNISAHYDTGNDFFRLWLDDSMSYSCALWKGGGGGRLEGGRVEGLEEAQMNKWDRLIELAKIQPGMRVLEVGCGWGAFSRRIAQRTGCHVTAITLSIEQLRWCEEKAAAEDLTHLCHYQLVDYRVYGTAPHPVAPFDRIVSCEMLEAVGHEYLPQFFHHCSRLLAPHGLLVTQVITFPDGKYDEYRKNVDFIREQIFPGGLCPSLTALADAMVSSGSGFTMESVDNIGPHYVRTLGCWRERLLAASAEDKAALRLTEAVLRKWDYYFVYCQAGFLMRCIGVLHIVFTRPSNNASLDDGRLWWP